VGEFGLPSRSQADRLKRSLQDESRPGPLWIRQSTMAERKSNRAIFLDRDGTLLVEVGYLNHPSLVVPYHFTYQALRMARESGYVLIVVTNQSGISRGYLTEADLEEIHRRMQEALGRGGAGLDAIYYCPHHHLGTIPKYRKRCACRKPGTLLGEQAVERFKIDLGQSFMIGDKNTDLQFGSSLGVAPCLVRTGFGAFEEWRIGTQGLHGIPVFDNLLDAVTAITLKRWVAQ
jgi:D-glycero-D-manno-heptose 1,7-bisphosphate phosphatase